MDLVLEMVDVCKTFYGDGVEVKANDHANFNLRAGEIHALLGENGAGKSTLVGSLFTRPDSGVIRLNGKEVELKNPTMALEHGLAIARQDLTKSLVERHSIAENVLSISQGFFLSLSTVATKIREVMEEYNLGNLNPHMKVARLSGGEKQRVEILKALITHPNIIILDEPTAMLTPQEVENLFELLKMLQAEGKSIVLITHHLEEAVRFSDRVTILWHGRTVETLVTKDMRAELKTEEACIRRLASLMVGKEVLYDLEHTPMKPGKVVLEVHNLSTNNDLGDLAVEGVDIEVRENQILGIAGIAGNGQTELIEAIINGRKMETGSIIVRGEDMTGRPIKEIRQKGIAYIPEDRRKALIYDLSIRENLILNSYQTQPGLLIDRTTVVKDTQDLIDRFKVKTPSALAPVRTLSGGNKQKVVLARELSINPPDGNKLIVIAENPTFGLDVGTTHFIREELLQMRTEGAAIVLVSGDLKEILSLSDVIAVMCRGKIMGVVERAKATRDKIGLLMGGSTLDDLGGNQD